VTAVVVVAAVVWLWPREKDPEYQGKKLSEWIDGYQPFSPEDLSLGYEQPTAVAIRAIGTNGLPFLIKCIKIENLPAQTKIDTAVMKIVSVNAWAFDAYHQLRWGKTFRGPKAIWAFEVLGPQASPAIPELAKIAAGNNEGIGWQATQALRVIGKDAVPVLLRLTADAKASVRSSATDGLLDLAPEVLREHEAAGSVNQKNPSP